jgi:predicted nucleic acid-binding protein
MEVLRGSRAHRLAKLRAALSAVHMLDTDMPLERFEWAAELYRRCRNAGVTVRKSIDCLIAMTAIRYGVAVLHDDSDFELIASVVPQFEQHRLTRSASAPNS